MIDEDWRGFVTAFSRAVRPDGARAHPTRRLLLAALVAVLTAGLAAVVNGALGGTAAASPADLVAITAAPTSSPRPGTNTATGTWSEVIGPTCPASTDFSLYGYSAGTRMDGTTGWTTSTAGGYGGSGCAGGFVSMPVSGKATAYDDRQYALWKFTLGSAYASASCQLSVYVPFSTDLATVGGNPAYYYYYDSDVVTGALSAPLGGFLIDQITHRGLWVDGPSFTAQTGEVVLKLVDAGIRSGTAAANTHVAAGQTRLTCRHV